MPRKINVKLLIIILSVLFAIIINTLIKHTHIFENFYIHSVFLPLQSIRNFLFNYIPFSIGDFVYLTLGAILLFWILKLLYQLLRFSRLKLKIKNTLLNIGALLSVSYFMFVVLWGGNYNRIAFTNTWKTSIEDWNEDKLLQLTYTLLNRMNRDKPLSEAEKNSEKNLNEKINLMFQQNLKQPKFEFKVKPTSLGNLLFYIGVQGYYNPFTGEAQINTNLPAYVQPFVYAHEMAHQYGIAAEDEANLIAYILCSNSDNPKIRYSGDINIFLYAIRQLRAEDSVKADLILSKLNENTVKDIENLRTIHQQYKSVFRNFSNHLYDSYLKWQGLEHGLSTYSKVTHWAYIYEFKLKEQHHQLTNLLF